MPIDPDKDDSKETVDDLLMIGERRIFSQRQLAELSNNPQRFEHYKGILGDEFYSTLMFSLIREHYSEPHARDTWDRITQHRQALGDKLGRDVGIAVAAMDYAQNIAGNIESPVIMDEAKSREIASMATRDPLTGLYLRSIFDVSLEKEIEEASRYQDDLALLIIDADDFKEVNDVFGHPKGDEVLHRIGEIISENSRTPDVAARYGGEEFALILPKTDREGAYAIAERIRASCQTQLGDTHTTVSIGIATYGDQSASADALIKAADEALYRAKQTGKNRICWHRQGSE
mgnify:CR=1 FL=1